MKPQQLFQDDDQKLSSSLADAEMRANEAEESNLAIEAELNETKTMLEEEKQEKRGLTSRLKTLEQERESLTDQLEAEEESRKALEGQMVQVKEQYSEAKWKLGHLADGMFALEDTKQKNAKEIDELEQKIKELQLANEKLNENKRKLSTELEDVTHVRDTQRNKILELEKNQRNSYKMLAEEEMNSDRIKQERDNAKQDLREKETKVLALNRELENTLGRLEESEHSKRTLQNELAKRAQQKELGEDNVDDDEVFPSSHNSESDFEFRPAVAMESRNHRLSIGNEIQQMNLPISQMPLHDLEFRYTNPELFLTSSQLIYMLTLIFLSRRPEVDTRDASTQTSPTNDDTSSYVVLGLIFVALAAIFIYNFMVEVEYHYYF